MQIQDSHPPMHADIDREIEKLDLATRKVGLPWVHSVKQKGDKFVLRVEIEGLSKESRPFTFNGIIRLIRLLIVEMRP